MERTVLEPRDFPWFDYRRYSFSLGLAVGAHSYLSGHTASAYDAAAKRIVVTGGMEAQAEVVFDKIEAILDAAGRTLGDVVRLVEYLTPAGIERYAEAESVRAKRFGDHRPAIVTVPVKSLLRPDALIEIEATTGPTGHAIPNVPGAAMGYESDGLVYLPSLSVPDAGRDTAAQTDAIFEEAARILDPMGLSLANLARTTEFISPDALGNYRTTAAVRRERLGPVYPAATGIVVPRLVVSDAQIQIDMIATRGAPAAIDTGWARYAHLTYSPAVLAGRHLFISGQGAVDPETGEMQSIGDVVGQAEFVYRNILEILAAAGAGPHNLVKTVEYTTTAALAGYRAVADVRRNLLAQPYPASTGPVCEAMVRPEMLIEVDATAILDGG